MIINHPYPVQRSSYWRDLSEEYTTDYEVIKKFQKLTKYQIPNFIKKHNFTQVDLAIAAYKPSKKQFEYLKNVKVKKEFKLKQKFLKGIKHLLIAKEILEESTIDLYAF
mmetsp:Transcript_10350/g.9140  ORF Transcript_10350/g.9140 Transcript_10350/m.9140 type:complete len:109 (+) Transcript_10350:478-804(+)